jgi:hypothetical protein
MASLIAPDNLVYAIAAPCLGGAGEGGGIVEDIDSHDTSLL